jgi:ATP-dependent exoDNAse (exonuclease V) alpha subunit
MHRNINTAKSALIRDWEEFTHKNPGKTTLIMAVKNTDVRSLNDQVRRILRDRGELQGPDVSIKTKGGNKSQVATDFAVGDKIVLARTDRELDVTNNSKAQITDIRTGAKGGHILSLQMEDGRKIDIDTLKFKDPESGGVAIRHGYASTAWSAQGATVDRAFVLAEGMDRRYGYVAMSRHREAATLYVNEGGIKARLKDAKKEETKENIREELAKQLHRKTTKPSTLDFEGDRFAKAQERAKKERDELMARLSQRGNPELEQAMKDMDDKVQRALDEAEARKREAEEARRKAEEEARRAAEQQQSTLRVK